MGFGAALLDNLRALPASIEASWQSAGEQRRNFVLHLHPVRITARALRLGTTFGLGIITLALALLLAATGVLLMLYYSPAPESAYGSMLDIEHLVVFGGFVRRLHRFAGHAMVVAVGLHLLRVCATSAFRGRELNWWIGLVLLGLVLGLAFTGYLLVWDQTAYWAVQVAANLLDNLPLIGAYIKVGLLGGERVGAASLLRFYTLHAALLPGGLLGFVIWHLWRIRRDNGLARPPVPEEAMVPAWPNLVLREVIIMLAVVGIVGLAAVLLDAGLGPPADPLHPANPEKAPWYFIGLQELVSYSALTGGVLFPAGLFLCLVLMPLLDREEEQVGVWIGPRTDRLLLGATALFGLLTFVAAEAAFLAPDNRAAHARWPALAQDLINPAGLGLLAALIGFVVIGRLSGRTRPALRAALVVLVVFLIGATFIGACRGPDWMFSWPW